MLQSFESSDESISRPEPEPVTNSKPSETKDENAEKSSGGKDMNKSESIDYEFCDCCSPGEIAFEFLKAKARDRDKVKWCELNEINIVELKYDESDEQWEDRIRSVLQL